MRDVPPHIAAYLSIGKHDGQTLMVREDNAVTAHQWVAAEGRWQKIGDVVGGSGGSQATSGKQLYNGKVRILLSTHWVPHRDLW